MRTYPLGLVPGPSQVPRDLVLEAYGTPFGSADLELEFLELYKQTQALLRELLRATAQHEVVIQSGEGMLALWSALKSCVKPGDKVLAVANGVYGYGFADMARQIGAQVEVVGFEYDEATTDYERIREAALRFRPSLITAVHCETPSGILNPVGPIGKIAREVDALFYVDVVSSFCGADVRVAEWGIDLALVGSQKCLGLLPNLSIVCVSPRAWPIIQQVNYVGYDALLPWRMETIAPSSSSSSATEEEAKKAEENEGEFLFPYTCDWHSISALHDRCNNILHGDGLDAHLHRHETVAQYTRHRLRQLGLQLWLLEEEPEPEHEQEREHHFAPTVTAVKVPEGWTWRQLDKELRLHGVVFGGSYGPLAGNVFRVGHMGLQADMQLVREALDALELVLQDKKHGAAG
ncbi:alanine--glyoxylate transaminase [Balamuthia mandrillaris]